MRGNAQITRNRGRRRGRHIRTGGGPAGRRCGRIGLRPRRRGLGRRRRLWRLLLRLYGVFLQLRGDGPQQILHRANRFVLGRSWPVLGLLGWLGRFGRRRPGSLRRTFLLHERRGRRLLLLTKLFGDGPKQFFHGAGRVECIRRVLGLRQRRLPTLAASGRRGRRSRPGHRRRGDTLCLHLGRVRGGSRLPGRRAWPGRCSRVSTPSRRRSGWVPLRRTRWWRLRLPGRDRCVDALWLETGHWRGRRRRVFGQLPGYRRKQILHGRGRVGDRGPVARPVFVKPVPRGLLPPAWPPVFHHGNAVSSSHTSTPSLRPAACGFCSSTERV